MIWQGLAAFLNLVILALGTTLNGIIGILPGSPFSAISNAPIAHNLAYLNWIIPVAEILAILQVWLVAVGIFYVQMIVLRWIKAIE